MTRLWTVPRLTVRRRATVSFISRPNQGPAVRMSGGRDSFMATPMAFTVMVVRHASLGAFAITEAWSYAETTT